MQDLERDAGQPHNEMATPCKNSKIRIDIYSEDHNPAHAHLSTGDGVKICRFYIFGAVPKNSSEVAVYKGDKVPDDKKHLLSELVKWGNASSPEGFNNWKLLMFLWRSTRKQ